MKSYLRIAPQHRELSTPPTGKFRILGLSLIVIVIFLMSCVSLKAEDRQGETAMATKTIQQVLKEHTNELMSLPGVVGTGQGLCNGKPCIKVYVSEMTAELSGKIPPFLEGYPVAIQETGVIRALPKKQD